MSSSEENKDLEQEGQPELTPAEIETPAVPEDSSEVEAAAEVVLPAGDEKMNLGQEQALEMISYVVVNLVDHPEDVTFDLVKRQGRDVYQVHVNPEDLGKVIGKGGQTARALRVLLMAFSARTEQRIGLEIVE